MRIEPAPLKAGAAQVDITPRAGVHLAGDIGVHRPAKLVAEPTFARAVVLESEGRQACLLALDVCIVCAPYTALIRRGAAERFGFDPDAVMVHATQTHSAPSLGNLMVDEDFPELPGEFEWVLGGEKAYGDWAAERALEAIGQARQALHPVQIAAGSGIEGRLAFNRRAVTRDGSVMMPGPVAPGGPGPTHIRYMEGPIDPAVGVICLRRDDLTLAALIAHHTCHPVHLFPRPIVSPDWPGALCDELQRAHGPGCVPLVINGACGNINPWSPFDPDHRPDHRRMGRLLAKDVGRVLETLTFADAATLDWRVRRVKLPLRELSEGELDWARGIMERSPVPAWTDESRTRIDPEWMVAASIFSVHLARRRGPAMDYEIQVLRLGDAAIVGLPGEPFVEGQLALKIASPTYPTYVAHCTSHYVGYIPTREALTRGGHEVNTRYWAKLTPEALELIVAEATGLLREVFC